MEQVKTDKERLYEDIMRDREARGINISDLGEDMAVGKQVIGQYWKPRSLIDHRNRTAVEFMSLNEKLRPIKGDDILWETLSDEEKITAMAVRLSFHYPSFIYPYQEGVAMVEWQLRPDGMYDMDEDGFGMRPGRGYDAYNIYGFIDRRGQVLSKFRHLSRHGLDEKLDEVRSEAQSKNICFIVLPIPNERIYH